MAGTENVAHDPSDDLLASMTGGASGLRPKAAASEPDADTTRDPNIIWQ